jgi:hypothetical protein
MPFRIDTFHLDRIVIGVARGDLTVPDLQAFYDHLIQTRILHYRKILDVAGARSTMRQQDLAQFAASLKGKLSLKGQPSGGIAIVADPTRADLAVLFARMTSDERPAQVFRSIHDARRWLQENAPIRP